MINSSQDIIRFVDLVEAYRKYCELRDRYSVERVTLYKKTESNLSLMADSSVDRKKI